MRALTADDQADPHDQADPADPAVRAAVRRAARRLLPLMGLLYVVNYLDKVNIAVAAEPMDAELGFTATVFGLGAGLLFVGYTVFELPSNLLLRRFGARVWIAAITAAWGLVAAAGAFVQDQTQFYLVRFLLGVCEAGFLPGMMLYLTQWFPRGDRGRFTALFMLAVPVTLALGTPVSSLLLGVHGAFGLPGWRFLLLAEGLPAVLLGAAVLAWLPRGPATARWLPTVQRTALQRVLAAEATVTARHGRTGLWSALRDPRVYAVGLIGFGIAGGSYALTFFLPQIVSGFRGQFGATLSTLDVGLISAIPFALSAIAMWWYARRSDRAGERLWHIAVPLLPAAVTMAAALYLRSPVLVMAAITVTTVGTFMALPVWWQLPGMFLTGPAAAGGIGVIAAVGNASGFVAPYLTGWLRDLTGHYQAGLLVFAAFLLLAAAGALALRRDPAFTNLADPAGAVR